MRTALLPKEHGAYGQMAFPLLTSFAVAGVSIAALLTAVAIVAGFLAHEPVLVLLGMRGARAGRELSRDARRVALVLGGITCAAGALALWTAPPQVLWSFALPLIPAALLVAAITMREEKSWHAEIAVALTFSLAAVPLCLAAGSSLPRAMSVAVPFALIFVGGTLAVRTVILRVRGGGDARAVTLTRMWALAFVLIATVVGAFSARRGYLPWVAFVAALPGLVLSAVVAVSSIKATRLKTIGWSLVGASTITAIIVIMGM